MPYAHQVGARGADPLPPSAPHLSLRFRHWRTGGVPVLMRLLFNPFRVEPSGRSDHSRGSHPGLFYPTLSASALSVTVEVVSEISG